MNYVVAKRTIPAELTTGGQYEVCGETANGVIQRKTSRVLPDYPVYGDVKNGLIILNDAGLLMTYKLENFK